MTKANMTINHKHLVAVHENEEELKSDFKDNIAKEEGTSTDDEKKARTTMKVSCSFKTTYYVLFMTSQQFQKLDTSGHSVQS